MGKTLMIRAAVFGLAASCAMAAATGASAATFVFNTTSASDGTAASKNFTANQSGYTISMRATGWHANSLFNGNYSIATAQLGTFTPGLGVLASGESYGDAEHQIDNVGGVDFVMLQFSENVNLSGIGRAVYNMGWNSPGGTNNTDSDAGFRSTSLGSAATWNQAIDLTQYQIAANSFTALDGTPLPSGSSYTTPITTNVYSSTWLIAASFTGGADGRLNDGFKLASVNVNFAPPSVPEPATWAMMLVGFGGMGAVLRRKRPAAGLVKIG